MEKVTQLRRVHCLKRGLGELQMRFEALYQSRKFQGGLVVLVKDERTQTSTPIPLYRTGLGDL